MSSTPSRRAPQDKRNPSPAAHGPLSITRTPMAIPHARDPVPPPLPPPSYIRELDTGQDLGWQWGNNPNDDDFGRPAAVKAGSSLLLGSFRRGDDVDRFIHHPFDQARRSSSVSTVTLGRDTEMLDDIRSHGENDASLARSSPTTELQGERDLRQRAIEESSHSYDKQLLNRIGGPNTPKRQSLSYTSGNIIQENGPAPTSNAERRNSSAWSISMPERRNLSVDSTSAPRWPFAVAASPGSVSPWTEPDSNRSGSCRHSSLVFDGTGSHRGSYDYTMFVNDASYSEDGPMSGLQLHDYSPGSTKAGSKRRASSPPREREDRCSSLSSASSQHEGLHRNSIQAMANRTSPGSRFHPNHSSLSSSSSTGPRHGSLGSSLGMASVPSSATSYGSDRVSPSLLSSTPDRDTMQGLLMASGTSHPNSAEAHYQRTLSETTLRLTGKLTTDNSTHSRTGSLSHTQGMFICKCCPKKPRKFDTEDELRLHENEKQYTCAYCDNRFKNKNEAERHQNSLHLRRQSWSCSALTGVEAAFHASSAMTGADVCGYCGQEFSNPPQWDLRAEHLNYVHKFGECNQSKKFFRADHFRQHLKHSHHGTSGKWTNVLENACVKDEPVPEKRAGHVAVSVPSGQAPPALLVTTTGLPGAGPGPPGPETIEETPHDC